MHTERRILTNTAVLGAGEALGQVASFVFVVACARAYGTDTLGWYSLGMAVGAIGVVLAGLGMPTSLLRELAQRPEASAKHVGGTLPYQLALSALLIGALVAALELFVDDENGRWIVAAIAAYHLLTGMSGFVLIPLRARQIIWPTAMIGAAQRIAIVAAALTLMGLGSTALPVFGVFPAAAVLTAALSFGIADRFLGHGLARRPNSLAEQRALYADGMPFFGTAVLDVIYSRLGMLMLMIIVGAESAGVYTAADRLLVIVSIFRVLFLGALFPAVAHFAATDRARALELANRSMRLILVLTIPAAGLLAIFHRELIALMFGDAFDEAARILLVLTPLLVVRGINSLWASHASAVGLQAAVVRARMKMIIVFVVAGAGLIMVAGPLGLAAALIVAEGVYGLALRGPLAAHAFLAPSLPLLGRPLASVAAGAAVYVALAGVSLPLQAAGVITTIIVMMFALGAVRPHDVRYLRSILSYSS